MQRSENRPARCHNAGEHHAFTIGDSAAGQGRSMVRLVNALPANQSIDVSGDDRTIFSAVSYKGHALRRG